MTSPGKRLKKARGNVDRTAFYTLSDAVKIVKENANTKFDETVDVALNLGVDPKHADQMVRGVVSLPHGTGKSLRVAVFAKGDKVTVEGNNVEDVGQTAANLERATVVKGRDIRVFQDGIYVVSKGAAQ